MKKIIFLLLLVFLSCSRDEFDTQVYFILAGQLYSMNTDGGNMKRLTNDSNTYNSVSSSPCGEYIILSTDTKKINTMRYDGENFAYLMDGQYPTYGPSGRIYFVTGTTDNIIVRYDPSNGSTEYLYTLPSGYIYSLSCNRDETILVFYYWDAGPSYIARMSLVTPYTPVTTSTATVSCYCPSFSPTDDRLIARTAGAPYYIRTVSPDNTFLNIYTGTTLSSRPAWTADGEHIYFADNSATTKAIKIMNSDGSDARTIAEFSSAIDCFCVRGKPR